MRYVQRHVSIEPLHGLDMPRQIIAMIRAGLRAEVLSSYTTWLCASCYACTVARPRQIRITDIMYAALARLGPMIPDQKASAA